MHFLLVLFFVALGSTSFVHDVPLFVWSGEESYITARNEQIRGYYTTDSVGELLEGFWKTGARRGLQPFVHPDQHLELVVLLVNSALSSEEFSQHHGCVPTLGDTMASKPSFYVPYVTVTENAFISPALKKAQRSGATAYYFGSDDFFDRLGKHAPITTISALSEITPAFGNGKADILVVHLDEKSDGKMMLIDQTVEELMKVFNAEGFSNYVVALTSVKSSLESSVPSHEEMGVEKRAIFAQAPGAAPNGTYPPTIYNGRNTFNVYFNGVFWELLVVMLVFWGVIGLGLSQLLQVQAPDRIPNLNAHKKKK